ncbi:pyridoxal phosphate-dependent aminotransferase [Nannocystis radixulma]|uniref:Aminotransferase n=1 Tax=Nannocystis radixulma TaxID=2995305 RepID=A0ABT5BC45_9BACT|nr:aminotransferase class I/II-fold pyridoxal phosphate-dependent enzyme [Nannocystis radixulma]MDC0671114.1 aminotransferase class I/II-fold pyridoxal phosphate-dependent enzyme [Nannocystis radixulma]
MQDVHSAQTDLTAHANAAGPDPAARLSAMAGALVGSEILKIAAEIRALMGQGVPVCNLTVGDFSPKQFPIPEVLQRAILRALERSETNYPAANGQLELRQAIQRFYERELGLRYPLDSFLVAGGARPVIYGLYRTVVDPGDTVIYPVPSWNNNHYVHMCGARGVPVVCGPETRFLPTGEALLSELPSARLVCLNSPLNPTGTAITADALRGICDAILAENRAREQRGQRPVYLMYDHIYWMLRFGDTKHVTPPGLRPEMARYTVFVDGISKAFAATGLRVGWAVGPVDIIKQMSAVLGHVGAWAPRPEQMATVELLGDQQAIHAYATGFLEGLDRRLELLHTGFQSLKKDGLQVDSIPPMGAIYLTVRINPFGRRTPAGAVLQTNEDVRKYMLTDAGIGIVPFQAFGVPGDEGWFRLSVGAVSEDEIKAALPRLARAMQALT